MLEFKNWSISNESLALAGVCLADMIATMYFVAAGMAVEQNPIMAFFINKGMIVFAIAKICSFVPFIIAVEMYRKSNPRFAVTAAKFAIAAYVVVFLVLTVGINFKFQVLDYIKLF